MRASYWSPDSWRTKPASQLPVYENKQAVQDVETQLKQTKGLVETNSIRTLRDFLRSVEKGEAFFFQAGDCAEDIYNFSKEGIEKTFLAFLALQQQLQRQIGLPVVSVGRLAGQCAKPRSEIYENREGTSLLNYRGDAINGYKFSAESREPDPSRMIKVYEYAASVLKALEEKEHAYQETLGEQKYNRLYASHEALLLGYEQALVRCDEEEKRWYGLSGHLLWVGNRTRQPDGAHIEFVRGLANPIGLKCSAELSPEDLIKLIMLLNPENETGRIVLIFRLGRNKVKENLYKYIQAIKQEGLNLIWCCDPMHGNTYMAETGFKTRSVVSIASEITDFFTILNAENIKARGLHLEMTGDRVSECVGEGIGEENLSDSYKTLCDPRLNLEQAKKVVRSVPKGLYTIR